jgi:hypothetical protein
VDKRISRVAAAVAAAGVETNIKILDGDAKTAVAAAAQLGCEVGAIANDLLARMLGATKIRKADPQLVRSATDPIIWTAAGTADSVMSMTYQQLLLLTEGKAMAVR